MNTARTIRRGITLMAIVALCVIIAVPAYAAYEDSLKGYWKMDDTSWDDDFSSDSLNTSRWTIQADTNAPYVSSGVLVADPSQGVAGSTKTTGLFSNGMTLKGDFDVQVDYLNFITYFGPGSGRVELGLAVGGANCYVRYDKSAFIYRSDINGSTTTASATNEFSGKLRLARSGSTVTGYYWNGSSWAQLGSGNIGTADATMGDILAYSWSGAHVDARFDNFTVTNGEEVTDAKGTNAGIIYGATQTTGKTGFGNALTFNGTSDYVSIPTKVLPETSAFSVGLWFNQNSNKYADLIWAQPAAPGSGIYVGSDRTIYFQTDLTVGDYKTYKTSASAYALSEWNYVVGVFDAETFKIYLNGQEMPTSFYAGTGSGNFVGENNYYIGGEPGANFFNGSIDDAALWSRALDGNEISMLYSLGTEKFEWLSLGVNDPSELGLGYTTSELKLLADLYAEGDTGAAETIDGLTWHYLSGDLPGDIGGTTYDYGDTWIYDGKYYLKLGSGLEGSAVPEPGCAFGLFMGFFVPGFQRLLKRRVRG